MLRVCGAYIFLEGLILGGAYFRNFTILRYLNKRHKLTDKERRCKSFADI